MGQGPGKPADRYPLHPNADQRYGIAARIDAVVAMGEGACCVADAAREKTSKIESQNAVCSEKPKATLGSYPVAQFRGNARLCYGDPKRRGNGINSLASLELRILA